MQLLWVQFRNATPGEVRAGAAVVEMTPLDKGGQAHLFLASPRRQRGAPWGEGEPEQAQQQQQRGKASPVRPPPPVWGPWASVQPRSLA